MEKIILTNSDVTRLAKTLAEEISLSLFYVKLGDKPPKCYPIPRGGVSAAAFLSAHLTMEIVDTPEEADFFVDDLIDSGETLSRYYEAYPNTPLFALISKAEEDWALKWITFPWEVSENQEDSGIYSNITRLLQYVGEDPERGGLLETPKRVAKAWAFWCQGYAQKPADVLKTFEDGSDGCDEMVVVKDIPFYSHCEHHMAPFFGTATIAYIPNGKIVGLSKLSRLLNIYARRLQVQERLTNQVVEALMSELDAIGAGCIIKARHMCMESRGVCQQGSYTITSALRGAMKEQPSSRSEFMSLAK